MKNTRSAKTLGARLKAHYESIGVSQQELAERFNTKQSWISRIYNGEFTSRSAIARELCENANISFFEESPSKINEEEKIYKIAVQLARLRNEDLEAVANVLGLLKKLN